MGEENNVDALLERYLHLLHEYTSLRSELSQLQAGVYQNLARANFSAERGMRFGQDYYDDRMQASRRVLVTLDGQAAPVFGIVGDDPEEPGRQPPTDNPGSETAARGEVVEGQAPAAVAEQESEMETKKPPSGSQNSRKNDPLKWFGLLTPLPLRQAQSQSVQAVEKVLPRLLSVNAEMAQMEIEVRRARKKRAKAGAAAAKKEQQQSMTATEIKT
ncbi:hypothetical protein BX600DRAFT_547709 [Xylariales sp. PMI_506]|nr:hypothetical protein BX600DRAFT_547709 [Xylariales sp. PMI_506]